jgi:hypothetical protein
MTATKSDYISNASFETNSVVVTDGHSGITSSS